MSRMGGGQKNELWKKRKGMGSYERKKERDIFKDAAQGRERESVGRRLPGKDHLGVEGQMMEHGKQEQSFYMRGRRD